MSLKKILVLVFLFVGFGANAQDEYVINDPVSTEGWSNNAIEVFQEDESRECTVNDEFYRK